MNSHLCFVILFYTVRGEWVEITPIENKRYISDIKNDVRTTSTTPNYENILKSPFSTPKTKFVMTTPAPLSIESTTDFNDYVMRTAAAEEWTTDSTTFNVTDKEYLNLSYEDSDETTSSNTIEEFLPFLKTIQLNLLKFKKTHKSKMSVLKHLRDNLLSNIKDIITNLWKPKASFEARGYHDEDTHMDFPSHEGALMTIGFLTFAVFLIKLIIKLIHALKNKQQNNGMTSTTTIASVVFLKRRKRDEEQEEMAKILQYIEEF